MKRISEVKQIVYNEAVKLLWMPAFYIYVLMCIGFNIYLFCNGVGYKLESIHADIDALQESGDDFANDIHYDYYGQSDFSTVLSYAKGERVYSRFANKCIDNNYAKLESRARTMEPEEQNSASFTGNHRLHQFLYSEFIRCLIVESVILIVLVVVYSMHFEKYYQTHELVLSCKYGIFLIKVKLFVAGVYSLLLCVVLWFSCLIMYFSVIDYSGIWKSYISSNYNVDKRTVNDLYLYVYPYVTWKPETQAAYFVKTIGISVLILIFTILLSGIAALYFDNDIKVMMFLVGGCCLMYCMGNLLQPNNILEYVFKLTPVHLITKCGFWFMDYAPGDSYSGYEILTVMIGILLEIPALRWMLKDE